MGPVEMLSAWDRRDRPREEVAAAGLQGFAVDKTFLSSLKGILLETELVTAASPTWNPRLPALPPLQPGLTPQPPPSPGSQTPFLPGSPPRISSPVFLLPLHLEVVTVGFSCSRKD